METISVFDIFKIGVGPSSSHTMGPWRAAQQFVQCCADCLSQVTRIQVDLYGSLAKTGKGHGTDLAIMLGLQNEDPVSCDTAMLNPWIDTIRNTLTLRLGGTHKIAFNPATDLIFNYRQTLPFHPNGLKFTAILSSGELREETYYSVGGGFILQENNQATSKNAVKLPLPVQNTAELLEHCRTHRLSIPQMVWQNELIWRSPDQIHTDLAHLWNTMKACVFRGCYTEGILPGGLSVTRRAARLNHRLLGSGHFASADDWLESVRRTRRDFQRVVQWLSCFALAVNEENAAFGRVVTAPTNGAAGVIPAVLMYYVCFASDSVNVEKIEDFLLTAGEFGSIFKKGATISAALGGCQAEIGVSSAMAAAGLAQCLGASPEQVQMAAEIAMEHHLGLTCDPVGGLVQIPCIERNAMGAVKAITAANLALESDPAHAKVTLDAVIKTMWETAQDMNTKYKETAEGGLALQVSVNVSEC